MQCTKTWKCKAAALVLRRDFAYLDRDSIQNSTSSSSSSSSRPWRQLQAEVQKLVERVTVGLAVWALQSALQLPSEHILNSTAAPAACVCPGLIRLLRNWAFSLELLVGLLALHPVPFFLQDTESPCFEIWQLQGTLLDIGIAVQATTEQLVVKPLCLKALLWATCQCAFGINICKACQYCAA